MARVNLGPFSLEFPDGWTLSTLILAGPPDEVAQGQPSPQAIKPFQRNLVVTIEQLTERVSPENYIRRQLDGLRQAGVFRETTRGPEKVSLAGGTSGTIMEQVVASPSGEMVRQMQLVVMADQDQGSLAYVLITSHLEGEPFEKVRDEFTKILTSFVL
jgi:hypothetical protein